MLSLQKKSHAVLLKLLNNIGIVGSILAAIADIIFVVIAVVGIKIEVEPFGLVLYSVVNALIGVLISNLLRYQGKKYGEIENEELCQEFYNKEIKEKKYLSMNTWMGLKALQDVLMKGCTTAFCIFGVTYITIQGTKNPIQILITLATLVLFACFGLMAMNSAYCRFYNIQIPFMEMKIRERKENSDDGRMGHNRNNNSSLHDSDVPTIANHSQDTQINGSNFNSVTLNTLHEQVVKEIAKVSQQPNDALTAQEYVNKMIEEINNETKSILEKENINDNRT